MHWTRRIVPPGWLLMALLASIALHRWLPLVQLWRSPLTWFGAAPLSVGCVFAAAGVCAFRRARTPVVPFVRCTALVTAGVYRRTRNPMYLGLVLISAGVAIFQGSLGAFLPLPALLWILQGGYIRAEERFLEEIFGGDYRRYKHDVRRWI
jgi:protein-S-isoprenylcysteine O-methyltransferase Ste14